MSPDVRIILWQGAVSFSLALAWISLWHAPFMQRYQGSTAPVNGVMCILFVSSLISGPLSFAADNWLMYGLMALGLSAVLSAAVAPLLFLSFRALMHEAGQGLLMPPVASIASLLLCGVLRLLLWLALAIFGLISAGIMGVINAF